MMSGVGVAILLVLGIGGFVMMGKKTEPTTTTTTATGAGGTVVDGPAIDTATADAIVLTLFSKAVNDTTVTAPTGYGNQVDDVGNDALDVTVGVASISVASPGTENPGAWTIDTSGAWCAGTVAIRPAAGGTVPRIPIRPALQCSFSSQGA